MVAMLQHRSRAELARTKQWPLKLLGSSSIRELVHDWVARRAGLELADFLSKSK